MKAGKATSVSVKAGERAAPRPLEIENISLGGLFVRCEEPLPAGARVVVDIGDSPRGEPLKLVGVVVSAKDAVLALTGGGYPGMGIRFDPLSAEANQRLTAYLVSLTARKDADALGAYNPALIDESMAVSRNAFDFGFVSLDSLAENTEPGARPAPPGLKRTEPAPATAKAQAPAPAQRAAPPTAPPPEPAAPPLPVRPEESARLLVQVRGLLVDLDDTQSELSRRSREIEALRAELEAARAALDAKDKRIEELEMRLARGG